MLGRNGKKEKKAGQDEKLNVVEDVNVAEMADASEQGSESSDTVEEEKVSEKVEESKKSKMAKAPRKEKKPRKKKEKKPREKQVKTKKEKKDKEIKESKALSRDHVSVISSMKTKIAIMVICAVVFTAVAILLIVIPTTKNTIRTQTQNYLYDVTISNGAVLEDMIENGNMQNAVLMKKTFGTVGLQGVDSSYAYVVNGDGTMLYHPTEEKIGQPVENAVVKDVITDIKMGKRSEPAVVSYDFNGEKKFAAYYVTKSKPAVLVISADEDEIMGPIQNVIKISIGAFIVVVIIFTIATILLTGILIRPIIKVSKIIGKMAHMDFTENEGAHKLVRRKDETGLMSRAVSVLRKEMIAMIAEIQKQSEDLFNASERLDHNASETAKTIEQVEAAVGDIASGATSQADETQNATENVITMGNMIEETNQEAELLEKNSKQMQMSSEQAMEILSELMQINEKTKTSIEEIYNQTNITNASAQKIKEATDIIAAIAEETNLLSLNASIEAARAGEQGRGFAVVASQIQKLAEQSNESAQQIDTITNALIQDSTKAVDTMHEVRDVMDEQSEKMLKTDDMFKQVNVGVENALGSVIQITGRTENLDESRERVVDVVQNLSAIAEENAASSEETSASVAEVSNILLDISDNATRLKEIAYQLDQSVKKIKI